MRVATYNVKHGAVAGIDAVADAIAAIGADVVALQEVVTDQVLGLGERLGMTAIPGPVIRWKGYGNALLMRVSPSWSTTVRFKAIRGVERRGCVVAGTGGLAFASTHLAVHVNERARQAAELVETLERWPTVVIGGDLNDLPGGPVSEVLSGRFDDCFAKAGEGDGLTFSVEEPQRRIDYIHITRDVTVRSCVVHTARASDHFPLVADIELPAGG